MTPFSRRCKRIALPRSSSLLFCRTTFVGRHRRLPSPCSLCRQSRAVFLRRVVSPCSVHCFGRPAPPIRRHRRPAHCRTWPVPPLTTTSFCERLQYPRCRVWSRVWTATLTGMRHALGKRNAVGGRRSHAARCQRVAARSYRELLLVPPRRKRRRAMAMLHWRGRCWLRRGVRHRRLSPRAVILQQSSRSNGTARRGSRSGDRHTWSTRFSSTRSGC
mmetsp:Transcript_8351/g.14056  ORF Transcript_8351/g.14056 Transcript_8351/m.14056 type:complete len:217 (-) Transcript_8351:194-844(-)